MAFSKPEKKNVRLKALIYGPTGCGKTVTGLQFPNVAVIDGERGTEHYVDSFNLTHVDKTSSIAEMLSDINDLISDPGDRKSLLIDPFTVFMDNLSIEYLKKLRLKKGMPDYEMQPSDHAPLKQKRKEIIERILCLDMNIVCTAREKVEYKQEGRNFMVPAGFGPEVPKEVPYMFDTIIRIEVAADGTRIAHCEKDRTNKLPKVFEFTYDKMVEFLGIESLERSADKKATMQVLDKNNGRTHTITFKGQTLLTAGIEADTLEIINDTAKKSGLTREALEKLVTESYSVTSVLDLKEDEGRFLITTLESL